MKATIFSLIALCVAGLTYFQFLKPSVVGSWDTGTAIMTLNRNGAVDDPNLAKSGATMNWKLEGKTLTLITEKGFLTARMQAEIEELSRDKLIGKIKNPITGEIIDFNWTRLP